MFTDEQDIERELKRTLNVAPTDDFAARVLRSVEGDRPPRRLVAPAWLAAAAAVILAAGGWFVATRDRQASPQPVVVNDHRPPTPEQRPAPPSGKAAAPRVTPPIRVGTRARTTLVTTTEAMRHERRVIVPTSQLAAIRHIVRQVNAGRLAVPEPAPPIANAPAELVIPPLVIEPIPVVAMEPGADGARGPKGLQ